MLSAKNTQNRKLKKYSQLTFVSSSSLLLTGCLKYLIGPIVPRESIQRVGTDGDDVMKGGNVIDIFYGSAGADSMNGYAGNDIVNYEDSASAVEVNFTTRTGIGGDAEGDSYISVEGVVGSEFADILIGSEDDDFFSPSNGADAIDGRGGSDTVSYKGQLGTEVNLATGFGTGGSAEGDTYLNIENIEGSFFNDILIGDDGGNKISGRYGEDIIDGGKGNDVISIYEDDNVVSGGDGDDLLIYDTPFNNKYEIANIGILKSANKLEIHVKAVESSGSFLLATVDSIEAYSLSNVTGAATFDIKDIWSDLAVVEQGKFSDEVEFLSWLGDDAGYNYEGL